MDFADYYGIIASIVGVAIFSGVIWAMSRKFTILEIKQSQSEEKQNKELVDLKTSINAETVETTRKITEVETEAVKQIASARVERKEEITKAIINQHERLEVLQRQIDAAKSDIKDMSSRITVVFTEMNNLKEEKNKICNDIEKAKGFMADWNQRIEDRVQKINDTIFDNLRYFNRGQSDDSTN